MLNLGDFCTECLCAVCRHRKCCGTLEGNTDWYCHEVCKGNDGNMNRCSQFEKEIKEANHMDIKEFAKSISGKEYGYPQFTKEEIETAKENGFVIVCGCSDDLMEFRGAIDDEGGCFGGGKVYFNCDEAYQGYNKGKYPYWINAVWCGGEKDADGMEITWTYETDIPHETFMIYEDGEPYCRGIVFSIDDVR